ncbi:MAG: hypothetical protein PHE27_06490, partial [Alphaproteobacteria bacterium]|nr:hypothetical protein [Alphaproteobacteria bacterium]
MPAPSIKRLAMICPTLVDQGGHEYDYTSMIASAALKKGIEPLTIIPKHSTDQIRLPGDTIRLLPDFSPSKTPLAFLYGALRRGLSYIRAFLRVGSPGTLWFVHSGSRYEMALLSIVWMILPHKEQKLVLFLRKEIEYSKRLLTSILRFASQNGVIFVSDGDELAEYMTKSLRSE